MYRAGFAHPLSLMHQRSKLLAATIYLFVRSESVLYERTQIDKVRPALNSFVRVHCFRSTASCCNRSLNSFAILAKVVRARQQSLTTQTILRPSCGLNRMPRLSSPPQVGGRSLYFSGPLQSFGMPRAKLAYDWNILTICTSSGVQTPRGKVTMY